MTSDNNEKSVQLLNDLYAQEPFSEESAKNFEKIFMTNDMFQKCMPHVHLTILALKIAMGETEQEVLAQLSDSENEIHSTFTEPLTELVSEILAIAYEKMEFEVRSIERTKELAEAMSKMKRIKHQPNPAAFNSSSLPRAKRKKR